MSKLDSSWTRMTWGGFPPGTQTSLGSGRRRSVMAAGESIYPRVLESSICVSVAQSELGDVALAKEYVPFLLRGCERDAEQRSGAGEKSRRRGAPPDAKRIDPPDQRQRRKYKANRDEDLLIKLGLDRQQEAHCVGVDDHHVEEIRRHPNDFIFEPREQDEDDDQRQRQRRR